METHRLIEFEEPFLEPIVHAVCECGWKSKACADKQDALLEHASHRKEVCPDAPRLGTR